MPARHPRRGRASRCGARRRHVRARRLHRPRPRRLLRRGRRRAGQRAQHDARASRRRASTRSCGRPAAPDPPSCATGCSRSRSSATRRRARHGARVLRRRLLLALRRARSRRSRPLLVRRQLGDPDQVVAVAAGRRCRAGSAGGRSRPVPPPSRVQPASMLVGRAAPLGAVDLGLPAGLGVWISIRTRLDAGLGVEVDADAGLVRPRGRRCSSRCSRSCRGRGRRRSAAWSGCSSSSPSGS